MVLGEGWGDCLWVIGWWMMWWCLTRVTASPSNSHDRVSIPAKKRSSAAEAFLKKLIFISRISKGKERQPASRYMKVSTGCTAPDTIPNMHENASLDWRGLREVFAGTHAGFGSMHLERQRELVER